MKFVFASLLASSLAEEENVALQSQVAMDGAMMPMDSASTYLSIDDDEEPNRLSVAKKQKQLSALVEQTSHVESAIQKRIAGQTASNIDDDLINDVKTTNQMVEDELIACAAEQQEQANALNDLIQAANNDLHHDLTGCSGVSELRETSDTDRIAHKSCRENQVLLGATRKSLCKIYKDYADDTHEDRPECHCENCGKNIPDADVVTDCLTKSRTWADKFSSLVNKQAACEEARAAYKTEKERCDGLQVVFEESYCAYGRKLLETCHDFDVALHRGDHGDLIEHRQEQFDKLTLLEQINAATSVGAKKLTCFIDLYSSPVGCTPAALMACQTAHYDTAHLELTYPDFIDPATCDASPVDDLPGDRAWKDLEYPAGEEWATKVQEVEKCERPVFPR